MYFIEQMYAIHLNFSQKYRINIKTIFGKKRLFIIYSRKSITKT